MQVYNLRALLVAFLNGGICHFLGYITLSQVTVRVSALICTTARSDDADNQVSQKTGVAK